MNIYRYSRWDGTQNLFELDADELMDELGRNLMSQGDLSELLRTMQREGIKDSQGRQLPGIEDLLQRLRQKKQEQLEKHKLDSIIEELRRQLDKVLQSGRERIRRRLEQARQKTREGASELSPEAQQRLLKTLEEMATQDLKKLDQLAEHLQRQIAQAQSLLDKLSAQDKESLENLLRSLLDKSNSDELAELADNLETICSGDEVEHQDSASQENPTQYTEAIELMEMLQKIDELEMQLNECQYNRSLAEVDEKLLEELLGDEAAQDVEKLRSIAKILE
ncbi:MAG: hypothetical protein HYY41_02910, partial [Chloroflexi bacterium]|nr:hypothetical protein [Chloroflexota bacterium]